MDQMNEQATVRYMDELEKCLRRQGAEILRREDGAMDAYYQQKEFGRFYPDGAMSFRGEKSKEWDAIKDRAFNTMNRVAEYMRLMEKAPILRIDGLDGDYRLLAEFNNVVLAGHQTRFGMEFVTWEWVQNHTSLWQGHYYGDNYDAAKQDFVTRSGLLPQERIFSDRQLTELYRCIHETLESDYPMTPERGKLLTGAAEQIEAVVPHLEELVQKSNEAELELNEEDDLGMTQRF